MSGLNELEEKINSILDNPAEMEKISRLASELFGAQTPGPGADSPSELSGMMGKLNSMLSAGAGDGKAELLKAISPYIAESRRHKLRKAMGLARMLRLAGTALGDIGGDGDV